MRIRPLMGLLGLPARKLSRKEVFLLEVYLWYKIDKVIRDKIYVTYNKYFHLIKINKEKRMEMLDIEAARIMVKDILESGDYNLEGIANYTASCEEVIFDVLCGRIEPSISLFRRLLEIHYVVKKDFYYDLIQKVKEDIVNSDENLL